jgi:hypothetical protein
MAGFVAEGADDLVQGVGEEPKEVGFFHKCLRSGLDMVIEFAGSGEAVVSAPSQPVRMEIKSNIRNWMVKYAFMVSPRFLFGKL